MCVYICVSMPLQWRLNLGEGVRHTHFVVTIFCYYKLQNILSASKAGITSLTVSDRKTDELQSEECADV